MDRSDEDALWRSIVENYGDRADLDDSAGRTGSSTESQADPQTADDTPDDTLATPDPSRADPSTAHRSAPDGPDGADHAEARAAEAERLGREFDERHEVPDRFTPPEPPPLPYVAPSRLLAWAALVGGPLVLVLSLALGYPLSGFWRTVAALAFVGGFVYLVARMPRDPREPWDDGARV